MTIKGIDVSKHQKAGNVNFKNLKNLGYDFVMLRAGYGKVLSQKDSAFESHYKAAKEAGLHIGAYHYSYATTVSEAKQEAKCFLTWIKDKELDYPVAFDIEDATQKKLTNSERTEIAKAFLQTVEDAGYYVMLYSSASWLGSKFDMDMLSSYDVWCAAYVGSQDNIKKYYDGPYGMWQYSSSIVVPTVYSSRLDHNYAYKDYAKIIKENGLNNLKQTMPSVPSPAPSQTPENDESIDLSDIENWEPSKGDAVEVSNADVYIHYNLPQIRYKNITGIGIVTDYREGALHPLQVNICPPSGKIYRGWVDEGAYKKPKESK